MAEYYATTALMPNGEKQKILLEDYQGSYLLLLFYPGDFGPMSKGQILDFAKKNEQFVNNGCQVQWPKFKIVTICKFWNSPK